MNVALSSLIASSSGEKSWKPPIFKHSGQNTEQENEPTEKVARKSTELTSEDTEHLLEGNDLCSKPKKSEINWRAISVVLLYGMSSILFLSSAIFPTPWQCALNFSTWCQSKLCFFLTRRTNFYSADVISGRI